MKKTFNLFSIIIISLLVFSGCTSSDTDAATTEVVPDATQNMVADTTQSMVADTLNKVAATTATTAIKATKAKITSVIMTNSNKRLAMNKDKDGYYGNVEVLPTFPGGQNALDNFINSTIEYPENANDNNVEGKVTVNFAVDEMGKVSNPKIVGKPLGYGLEEEVLKAVSKMPMWTPGVIKGKNVKTYYTLPVTFKLEQ